ncbi:PASTA domain-containing protein [bacterium]|nr:PASTA domain-containing protein [bacterium]
MAIFSIGAVLGLIFFDRVAMPIVIGSGKAYPIPNLVGMTSEDARELALSQGFRFKISRQEFSSEVPANRVLSQIPKAQSLAKKRRTIRVVVSKGGIKAVVPDVRKRLLRQAKIAVEDARLVVGEVENQYSDSIPSGMVIDIIPSPGETLSAGASVKLIVSMGAESGLVTVPNLVGMQGDEACKTLHQIGLKCIPVKRRIPTITDGEVFKQDPPPGTALYRGNGVKIMVNNLR